MWEFLREQFDHFPTSLRISFVASVGLAGINRIVGVEFQAALERCLARPDAASCVHLGIASVPYLMLAGGLSYFVVSRAIGGIRRRLSSGRDKEPLDGQ